MTDYWSGSITFTGLGSGTDFDSIIEANMALESYRLDQLESWQTQWESKLELVSDINTQLVSYESLLEGMDSEGEFLVKAATSADESIVGVSADSDAVEASHSIIVNQRAQNDVWSSSSGWESTDSVVTETASSFTLMYGAETIEIEVPANTTLENLVSRINSDPDMGDAVRASLINDGDEYHIQISGLDLGEDNTVTVLNSDIEGLGHTDFTNTQEAQNAQIKVDGYPPGADEWLERDTNTIDDVVDGLTFTLYGETGGEELDVTVATDIDAVVENILEFVEMTNAIRTAIAELDEGVTETSEESDDDVDTSFTEVRGNYGMDIVEQGLQDILATRGLGFTAIDPDTGQGDQFTTLGTVGITTDADESSTTFGLLEVDEETLREALASNADAVARLFVAEDDGVSYSSDFSYGNLISGVTEAGEYDVEYTIENGAIVSASINGHTASVDGWELTGAAGQSEAGLSVEINNTTDGTYSGTVCVREGKINQTLNKLDEFLDAEGGILNIIEDSYQSIIDSNAEAIEREEARLELKEANMVEMYARLEELLTEYEGVATTLENEIASLDD